MQTVGLTLQIMNNIKKTMFSLLGTLTQDQEKLKKVLENPKKS